MEMAIKRRLSQAREGWGRVVQLVELLIQYRARYIECVDEILFHLPDHAHPQPFSRLRKKGAELI